MPDEILILEGEEINSETAILDTINTTLVKANVTDAVIAKLKADYGSLKINGQEDKEGYLTVQEARKYAKRLRILAEKLCKSGRENAVKEQKLWLSKQSEVVGQISEVEDYLEKQEKSFEAERDRLKAEKKAREEQQFASRLQELIKLGGTFDGINFVIGENAFEAVLVREADIDIYQSVILPLFKAAWDIKEAERIATETALEAQRQKDEQERLENERIKKANEAETERLRVLNEEMERKKKENEDKERSALQSKRLNELLPFNPYGADVDMATLWALDETTYATILGNKKRQQEEQAELERQRIEDEKQAAVQRAIDEERDRQQKEAERIENQRIADEQRRIDEAEKASDKDKYLLVITQIRAIKMPDMKSPFYRGKIGAIKELVSKIEKL